MIYPSWTLYGTNMHNTEHNKGVADREHQSQTALERIGSQLVRVCSTCRTVGYYHNTFVWHAVCWHQFGIRARAFCAKLNWTAESYRSIMAPCCSTASCKNIKDGFFLQQRTGVIGRLREGQADKLWGLKVSVRCSIPVHFLSNHSWAHGRQALVSVARSLSIFAVKEQSRLSARKNR